MGQLRARTDQAKADRRLQILGCAAAVCAAAGYEELTVSDVAERAGVAKGTVFNFFPTKAAILLAYYEKLDAEFGAAFAAMNPGKPKAALTESFGRPASGTWWTESGSRRVLRTEPSVRAAIAYVRDQQFPLVVWVDPEWRDPDPPGERGA